MMDLAGFMTSLTEEIAFGDREPATVVDRYFTPDIVQWSDGLRIDRSMLVAHVAPVRKNLVRFHIDVHDELLLGDRIAARYTLHAVMRRDRVVATQIHMFGEIENGRFRRQYLLTRDVAGE